MKTSGPCAWCLAGTCCGDRAFTSFTCSHWKGCEMILSIKFHSIGFCAYHGREHHSNMGRCMKQKELVPMTHITTEAWKQIDEAVDLIATLTAESELPPEQQTTPKIARELYGARQKARGKAEILALLMPDMDVNACAVEASRRKHYRDQGVPYVTPGLPE